MTPDPLEPSATVAPLPAAAETAGRPELWMSNTLRLGTALSLALVVLGTLLTFLHHPTYFSSEDALARVLEGADAAPHSLSAVLAGIADASGRAITMVGLLLLIALPILRLAVAHVAFRAQGDRAFARLCVLVVALLVASFFLGAVE